MPFKKGDIAWNKGNHSKRKPLSDETKRRIGLANSIALKGKKQSKETIEKRFKNRGSWKIARYWLGKNRSIETKLKISKATTGVSHPSTSGEKNYMWKGGKPKCLECKKEISYMAGKNTGLCKTHAGKLRHGSNHHYWISDRSKLVGRHDRRFHDPEYKQWHWGVKNRDGWKCKISNGDCSGRVEAHHILGWKEYPELRYDINNGITLCHAHHPRKRAEEKRLSPYFQELVSVSKVPPSL